MRTVKCQVTGEKGYSYEFFKAGNGKYYKNKDVYNASIEDKTVKSKICNLINVEILNKNQNNCISLITKLINESGMDSKSIYDLIEEKREYLIELYKETSQTDASKIHGIFTIATKYQSQKTYAGCYEIRNLETNKVYIGESIDIFGRIIVHISDLYLGKHHCKELQEDFNKTKDIVNYKYTPLFIIPILNLDKKTVKHETLYLESAYYLLSLKNKESIYNTKNPYIALKNGNVSLDNYDIDCKKVLELLVEDKYNILPHKLKTKISDNLKEIIDVESIKNIKSKTNNINEKNNEEKDNVKKYATQNNIDDNILLKIQETKTMLKNGEKLYRITKLLEEMSTTNIIPSDYDYFKIRKIMSENNLIYMDSLGHTVATDFSIENKLYHISSVNTKTDTPIYQYYISEKGKDLLIKIFTNYENKNELSRSNVA